MGGTIGMTVGFLVGGMTVLKYLLNLMSSIFSVFEHHRYGPGEKGYLATVGHEMLEKGAFLGFIMR
jgi:hypothetical protein